MSKSGFTKEISAGKQYVYNFSGESTDGDASMKNRLCGKGANLAEIANIGLPVPHGFTISTEVCTSYYDHQKIQKIYSFMIKKAMLAAAA
jgi:pyruvate,orthophosphate dikinase